MLIAADCLPVERSPESLRHHFEVERELANRLRASTREERPVLVPRLYAELYQRVPDHPRTDRAKSPEAAAAAVRSQLRLLSAFLGPNRQFVEFGAGSGELSRAVRGKAGRVVAVEVCEQGDRQPASEEGVEWVYHDGLSIPLPDRTFDVAFSYQVLEHVHPDDVPVHLAEAARILKPGGTYVLSTPHEFSGPHDISRYFTSGLETFHLKEWTYAGLSAELRRAGFDWVGAFVRGQHEEKRGLWLWLVIETTLRFLPRKLRTVAARKILNNVVVSATRGAER